MAFNEYKNHPNLLRRSEVLQLTGLSKSTLYNRINGVFFPSPISLSQRAAAFVVSEFDTVIQAMIAGQTPEQIKALVSKLIQQRTKAA